MNFSLRFIFCFILVSRSVTARPSVFPMPSVSVVETGSGLNPISDVSVVGGASSSGSISVPVISVSNSSKEGIDIANRINHLFKNLDPEIKEPGGPDRTTSTNLNRISEPDSGSSQLKLNLNLDVEVQNGKPSRLALPHGELVVMFLPKRGGQNQTGGPPGFSVVI